MFQCQIGTGKVAAEWVWEDLKGTLFQCQIGTGKVNEKEEIEATLQGFNAKLVRVK